MDHVEANQLIRAILGKAVEKGYKPRRICLATLGSQNSSQFLNFIAGKDIGIKPLERIINSFEFDLRLVPVPREGQDIEKINEYLDALDEHFIKTMQDLLDYHLENVDIQSIKSPINQKFRDYAQTIIEEELG